MSSRPPIGFGDLVTALGCLGLLDRDDPAEAERVARILGVGHKTAQGNEATRHADEPLPATQIPVSQHTSPMTPSEPEEIEAKAPDDGATTLSLTIEVGARPADHPPAVWLLRASALPAPPRSDSTLFKAPLEPLFEPTSSRSLLASALAVWEETGSVDVGRLVQRMAKQEVARHVPRTLRSTLRRGVQVLVDFGPGMELFLRDSLALVEQIRLVAGAHRVEVLRFASDPLLAGPGPRRTWRDYRPPEPFTPIVALCDLGISSARLHLPVADDVWHRLAARAELARCRLVCVVPYPRRRWPEGLSELAIIEWDRSATVGGVRRLIGKRR